MNAPSIGLLAAIHAQHITPDKWIAWADRQIATIDQPPDWILDLSLARDYSAAWNAIWEIIEADPELARSELDEAALGLIALQYFEGQIDFPSFLQRAGDHTDPSGCSTDCEYFYHHLNRFEAAPDRQRYEDQSAEEIRQYLKEAIELGVRAKAQIRSITEQGAGDQAPAAVD